MVNKYYTLEATKDVQMKQIIQEMHDDTEHNLNCSQHYEVDGLNVTQLWEQIDYLKDNLATARVQATQFYEVAQHNKKQIDIANNEMAVYSDLFFAGAVTMIVVMVVMAKMMSRLGGKITAMIAYVVGFLGAITLGLNLFDKIDVVFTYSIITDLLGISFLASAVLLFKIRKD